MTAPLDRAAVVAGYRRNCAELEAALAAAPPEAFRRRSAGTRWSNEELLYHMVFGYIVVLALLPLVRIFGRLPISVNRGFADCSMPERRHSTSSTTGGPEEEPVFNRRRMAAKLRRLTSALEQRLHRETDLGLGRRMYFPTRWDPFFKETMTLADVYAYPVAHFDFHAAQLSLDATPGPAAGPRK